MSRLPYFVTLATSLFLGVVHGQVPPTRILPLGDSITFGSGAAGGYRAKLYTLLTAAGYNVDYVGVQNGNSVASLPDVDHQGIGGWRIDQVDSDISKWLNVVADPDVILLHIGTNDFGQNLDTMNAINRWDALIAKLVKHLPNAHIIATNLMERAGTANTNIVSQFNPHVVARINAHAALGRKVTFLDMRAAVPLAEMPDNLHPNQAGYDHMADAWAPAVQALVSPLGDSYAPVIARATGAVNRTEVAVKFSKPVADTAATVANFSLSGGLTISAATLDATKRIVTLTTSQHSQGTQYQVTVSGIVDRTPAALPIAAGAQASFYSPTPSGYLQHVPEAKDYTLAYSLDIPTAANYKTTPPSYSVNNTALIGPINRVAYYMELQGADGNLRYLWASMNAFTTDARKIGVPTVASGGLFQTTVGDLTVKTNHPGITPGTGLTGNLEFWPSNYEPANSASVSGASSAIYDHGDMPTPGNYGSMQLHHPATGQTLFSFSNWGGNTDPGDVCLGLGSNPTPVNGGLDWTFANNALDYTVRRLDVLVQTNADNTAPAMVAAQANAGLNKIVITVSEPVLPASIRPEYFTLSNGVTVLAASPGVGSRDIILITSAQPAGTQLTLTVSGLRDTSCNGNLTVQNSFPVALAGVPAEVTASVGAAATGYELLYSIDLPTVGNLNTLGSAAYSVDESTAPGGFDRVAYYLALQTASGATEYAWAAMDAWTASKRKLGIPLVATGGIHQVNVTNLQVISNVAGVVNGTAATGGNIEFWPNSYSAGNALAIPNGSATLYDMGDTVTGTVPTSGYGCLQIHHHATGAAQTVLAVNRFGTDGQTLDVGIGNNSAPVTGGVDWTFASNAGNYVRRTLHIMVRPTANFYTPPAVVANVGAAAQGYQLTHTIDLPTTGLATAITYSTNNAADVGSFTRVAYYLELMPTGGSTPNWVWTSMDAFTTDARKVALPTLAAGSLFQQKVNNLTVMSNVAGVAPTSAGTTGNIEFWPNNYSAPNALAIPGASGTSLDFGDTVSGTVPTAGHGSMQVHNHATGAAHTVFAINNFGAVTGTAPTYAIGIGTDPNTTRASYHPDWTFAANAGTYTTKRLHVFVLPASSTDTVGPVITKTTASSTLDRLSIRFNEPVIAASAVVGNFTLNGGLSALTATLGDSNEILLTTSPQTAGVAYTVVVNNVRDRSPLVNPTLPGASSTFTAFAAPSPLASITESVGFNVLYQLPMPNAAAYNTNQVPYSIDESRFPQNSTYDRVAYLMELVTGGVPTWVWVACDPFTTDITKLGVPTVASEAIFQQTINNMSVAASAGAPVVTGTGLSGYIEFWPTNYTAPNVMNVPNASGTNFDWGDSRTTTGTYGSMQLHNPAASQTLLAYNNWGGSGGNSAIGIGNDPAPVTAGLDWTFHQNAATYTTKNLYVLGRPGGVAVGIAPQILTGPCSKIVLEGSNTSFQVTLVNPGKATFQWRREGIALPNQTQQWLDLNSITLAQGGNYDCVITNAGGVQAITAPALLTVLPPLPPGSENMATMSALPNGQLALMFHRTAGQTYRVQRSTVLLADWIDVATVVARPDGSIPAVDPNPPAERAFYRIAP